MASDVADLEEEVVKYITRRLGKCSWGLGMYFVTGMKSDIQMFLSIHLWFCQFNWKHCGSYTVS